MRTSGGPLPEIRKPLTLFQNFGGNWEKDEGDGVSGQAEFCTSVSREAEGAPERETHASAEISEKKI